MHANTPTLSSESSKKTSTKCTSTIPVDPGSITGFLSGGQTGTPVLTLSQTPAKPELTSSAIIDPALLGHSGGFLQNKHAVAGVFATVGLILLLLLLSLIACLIRRRRAHNGGPHTLLSEPHHGNVSNSIREIEYREDMRQSDDGSTSEGAEKPPVSLHRTYPQPSMSLVHDSARVRGPIQSLPARTFPAASDRVDDAVVTVHTTSPNPIPPPPPANVIRPYNPIYDQPRPSKLEDYLRSYDVWFLVDDSSSMQVRNRWGEARAALNGLANFAIQCALDSNGINISFLNSPVTLRNIQNMGNVTAAMNGISLSRGTPTGARVHEILEAHLDKLDAAKGTPLYASIRPLDLVVITDGAPSDSDELTDVLINAGARIKNGPHRHHPNCMGVQFVQIGNNPSAAQHLSELLQADTGHMVDTAPYGGPGSFTPDTLVRILLGAVHPNIRAQRSP